MIRFYAIHFNRVDFISLQQRTLKSFVVDKHELIIINNGRDDDRTSIFTVCKGLGLQCHSVESPRFDLAGESHIRAMDYCLANFIQKDDDISVILDHDMFAFAPVSIRQMLDGYAVAGLAQGKGSVKYLFPGLVALDVPNLPNFADFNLRGGKVDGIQCDVGAQSAVYLRDNPPARVRWLSTTGSIRRRDNNYLPEGFEDYQDEYEMEIIDGRWLHHREGAKWERKPQDLYARKFDFMERFLDGRIKCNSTL